MGVLEINELEDDLSIVDLQLLRRATESLILFIDRHGETKQSFDVLRAIAQLTIERIDSGRSGDDLRCTAQNIVEAAQFQISESTQPGKALSRPWKELIEERLPPRYRGIQEFAAGAELKYFAWPKKEKSDGGHPSRYYLTLQSISDEILHQVKPSLPGQITYIRDLEPAPSWWAKYILRGGYRVAGWRRFLLLGYLIGNFLLGVGVVGLLLAGAYFSSTLTVKDFLVFFIAACAISWVTYGALRPFTQLIDWRIIMAPSAMISIREFDVQLELMRDPKLGTNQPSTIRLVRYASTCPVCGGKIAVVDGEKEFPNRLVGRCRENPAEHVYSFDRLTCVGKLLR